jgi:hypothetical protein
MTQPAHPDSLSNGLAIDPVRHKRRGSKIVHSKVNPNRETMAAPHRTDPTTIDASGSLIFNELCLAAEDVVMSEMGLD